MRARGPGHQAHLIQFWLRAVRVGILVTILTVGALAVALLLPGGQALRSLGYVAVLVAGALGGTVVAILPWARLFDRGLGLTFLYAWSAADIALISLAVWATDGRAPELFVVYVLTTVFFGAAYPPRAQVGLLAFTFAAYLVALAAERWPVSASALFLQLATLAIVALLTYFLSSDLLSAMVISERARADAERWATMLSSVSASARKMSLDREVVLDASRDAARDIGFDAVALCALGVDGGSYRILRSAGLESMAANAEGRPDNPAEGTVIARVTEAGALVRLSADDIAADRIGGGWAGLSTLVAVPVWVGGWLGAVMIAGARGPDPIPAQQAEALELLGAQLGLALDNIARFEQEHRMVEQLAELDRMKGDFLATVSHELRTPVTVIKGVGLTLERSWERLDPELRTEMIASLARNAASLDGLIANLLDHSRLEAGGVEIGFDVFDLSEVLDAVADRFEVRFGDRPLHREIRRGLLVEGDATLIERIVENVMSNAAVHTPPGTRVELQAMVGDAGVTVVVRDEGPGIAREELAHLGERFYRGGPINTRPKGLGLGLALAREMLELHGSELVVASEPGVGTSVSFALPAIHAKLPAGTRPSDGRR